MYAGVAGYGVNLNVLIMWSFFLINACCGLYSWHHRAYYGDKDAEDEEAATAERVADGFRAVSETSTLLHLDLTFNLVG